MDDKQPPPRPYKKGDIVYSVRRDARTGGRAEIVAWEVQYYGTDLFANREFAEQCRSEFADRGTDEWPTCVSLAPGSDGWHTLVDHPITFEEAKAEVVADARTRFDEIIALRPYDRAAGALGVAPKPMVVLVESPYAPAAGNADLTDDEYRAAIDDNVAYARRCCHDCLLRGEAPYATHLFLAQPGMLDDRVPAERALGIEAGLAWGSRADLSAVYIDRGVSKGMRQGVERARLEGRPVVWRSLERGLQWDHDPTDAAEPAGRTAG